MISRKESDTIPYGQMAARIDDALSAGIPFGMAILPDTATPLWFGEGYDSHGMTMEIAPWLTPFDKRITIGNNIRHQKGCASPTLPLPEQSTTYAGYIAGVRKVIGSCQARDGKTVYSRIICGKLRHATPGHVAEALFSANPHSLGFIYHTPQTGGWLGATPEILLDFDKTTGRFSTMALAGTRMRGTTAPWDEKNIRENKFVIDYITASLARLGIPTATSPLESVPYGKIEHLCSIITGTASPERIPEITDALNPTPALCGYPREDAIADIARCEQHPRGCYGGIIGFSSPTAYRAFVNLRCMHFDGSRYCIYGGGGITPQSVPEEEFAETEAKTSLLRALAEGSIFDTTE